MDMQEDSVLLFEKELKTKHWDPLSKKLFPFQNELVNPLSLLLDGMTIGYSRVQEYDFLVLNYFRASFSDQVEFEWKEQIYDDTLLSFFCL